MSSVRSFTYSLPSGAMAAVSPVRKNPSAV